MPRAQRFRSYEIENHDSNLFCSVLRSGLDHDKIVSWFRSILKYLPPRVDCITAIGEAIRAQNRDVVRLLIGKSITTESIDRCYPWDGEDWFYRMTPLDVARKLRKEFESEDISKKCKLTIQDFNLHFIKVKTCEFIIQDIELHMIKVVYLKYQGEAQALLSDHGYSNKHQLECQKELEKMKEEESGTRMSLYHVLTTRDPSYTQNEVLLRDLESVDLAEFPLYGSMIAEKLIEDKEKAQLFKNCTKYLGELVQKAVGVMLPSKLLEKILFYLEHYDLYMLECCSDGVQAKPTQLTKSTKFIDLLCYKRKLPQLFKK